ncbi:MAG: hypothetical protein CNF02_12305 [OM182 bacterium MED-G28]|uniref:Uncharacterized protein n=1 Tax=OM182 bacterium MED-G28 TaxID=1986256 RepID=A0A2A5W7Q9_9GAMM|nr:MAG: hypothetical protein CNF02_12305 [OM182 bacterium MED-G28]
MVFLCWSVSKQVLLSFYFFLVAPCAPLFGDGISGSLSYLLNDQSYSERAKIKLNDWISIFRFY